MSAKKFDLGNITTSDNTRVDKTFKFKRNDKSPNVVKLTYSYNYLKKECVDYDLVYKTIKGIDLNVCESGEKKGSFDCKPKKFESFEVPKRVCVKKGYTLQTKTRTLRLVFLRSIELAPNADEVFQLSISQPKMASKKIKLSAKVIESDSLYKVNNIFNKVIEFKAR